MLPQFCHVFEGVYHVTTRVQEIDPCYVVVYNAQTKRLELWHISFQAEFCMQLGHDGNLADIKERVYATSGQNMRLLFEDIQAHNNRLEQLRTQQVLERSQECLKTTLMYAEQTNKEPNSMQMQKIMEGSL